MVVVWSGPVNNILVIRQPPALYPRTLGNNLASIGRRHVALPPPLEKYSTIDENSDFSAYITPQPDYHRPCDAIYATVDSMNKQINELQVSAFFMNMNNCAIFSLNIIKAFLKQNNLYKLTYPLTKSKWKISLFERFSSYNYLFAHYIITEYWWNRFESSVAPLYSYYVIIEVW